MAQEGTKNRALPQALRVMRSTFLSPRATGCMRHSIQCCARVDLYNAVDNKISISIACLVCRGAPDHEKCASRRGANVRYRTQRPCLL